MAPGVLLGDVETEGYATLWRFYDVIVEDEAAFDPNVIKSMDDVRAMGFAINTTVEFMVAPMLTRDPVFQPVPSNPPGEGLMLVWYRGAGVYLDVLESDILMPQLGYDGNAWENLRTVNITVIVDGEGTPYPGERPILDILPSDEANYSAVWALVEASGGEGYRQGRSRTLGQLRERGWSLNTSGDRRLAGFVAGPVNVPAWKPDRFTFVVGPVVDEDGRPLRGVEVRVSRGVEVVQGRTDAEGKVSFEVNSTWNGETVQTFLSKDGYYNSNIPAEIEDYEHFVPSGGDVPPMVSEDDGEGLEGLATFALAGVLVVVLFVIALLLKGRSGERPSISDEEADEILSDELEEDQMGAGEADPEEGGGSEEGDGEDHLTVQDVEEIESGPERLS